MKNPLTLVIMDGFALSAKREGNAIKAAHTPNIDRYMETMPSTRLSASGLDVGLPDGQMGNSEVGHTNIGAGRVVYQDLPRITKAIEDGSFFWNDAYLAAVRSCLSAKSSLHILGLMSDGGVHSMDTHFWAMLEMAKRHGLKKVYLHCFMDGRDVPPTSGRDFIMECADRCAELGVGKIATIMGRYYAMDRDKRWERVQRAYAAMVYGEGGKASDPAAVFDESYARGVTDEFIEPVVLDPEGIITENDSAVFINFRPDRAREITRAFVDPDFDGFERRGGFFPLLYVCTTEYDALMPNVKVAFPPHQINNTLGQYISDLGLKQLRIAETEKYAHVTFFLNGGREEPYTGEDRVLVPSPKIATYDLKPEMSAYEVTEEVTPRIKSGAYDVIIINYANCDMVGHTGVWSATKAAVEAVDICLGRVVEATSAAGGITIITADHGNADKMLEDDGISPFTAHSTNPVPFIICGANVRLNEGRLCDIAPTMLELMGLLIPEEMTGASLIDK